MGIERIAMLNYQIGDIRMFYENDIRVSSNLKLLFKIKRSGYFVFAANLSCFKENKKRIFTSIWARNTELYNISTSRYRGKKAMKKDIIIPEVENVFVAAVQEWRTTGKGLVRLLVNDSDFLIEKVVSKAFNHRW
jgi:hypothetical protein